MKYFTFFLCLLFIACSDNSNETITDIEDSTFNWTVPQSELRGSFAPFPLATNLKFKKAKDIDFIFSTQKVAVVKIDDEIKIYPSHFTNIFEVVNDQIGDVKYAVTYCPITESIVLLNRIHKGQELTLIASGYLYKDNQVLFDKRTGTYWSQMELDCIRGTFENESINTFSLIQTSWQIAQTYFPNAEVFVDAMKTSKSASKTITKKPKDKTPYYGVVNFNAKDNSLIVFGFDLFQNGITIEKKITDGLELIVVGSKDLNFITSFINYDELEFSAVQSDFPNIMTDSDGNTWDVFGNATSGIKKGEQLSSPTGFFASRWAWDSFYDIIVVHE